MQIGPIRLIQGGNRGRYPFCNTLYIEGAGLIIDPGAGRECLGRLRDTEDVQTVWLSHWHEDHWGNLDLFDDLPLAMSPIDAPPMADLDVFFQWYGIDQALSEYWRPIMLNEFHFRSRTPNRLLEDGEVIELAENLSVEVIHSPGHTPGHLSFYFRENETLFLGDMDLTPFGPWYGDRDSDIDDIYRSVTRLREIPARRWICSHETGFFPEEPGRLWDDYIGVIQRREDAVLDYLKTGPHTLEETSKQWIVYGKRREPEVFYAFGERNHMVKHLERLMARGSVAFENDRYYLL